MRLAAKKAVRVTPQRASAVGVAGAVVVETAGVSGYGVSAYGISGYGV